MPIWSGGVGAVGVLAVLVPLAAVLALVIRRGPDVREVGAAITATAWAGVVLVPLHLLAPALGWWTSVAAGDGPLEGLPLDLVASRVLLWGTLPALAVAAVRPLPLVAAVVALDLAALPLRTPALVLGDRWVVGEAVAVALGLLPALALAVWTRRRRHVLLRGWAQATGATGLLLVLPTFAVATAGGGGPSSPWPLPVTLVGTAGLLLVGLPTLAAMRELAVVGHGTPLPHDPPDRLVTSGPYAYVRNPMQMSIAGSYAVLALLLGEPVLLLGTLAAVAFAVGPAERQERRAMGVAFGRTWHDYRAGVRPWVPRRRPWPGRAVATLVVAPEGRPGAWVGRWLAARQTVALALRPASGPPGQPQRLTYEADGVRVEGVAAFARALDHLTLGWAMVGWAVALPLPAPRAPGERRRATGSAGARCGRPRAGTGPTSRAP